MEQDGHLKTLAERIKEKAEQERIETEKIFTEQLQTLSSNLQESSTNALRTMSDAMAQEITSAAAKLNQHYRLLSTAFAKKWIGSTMLGIFACIGMMIASWGWVKVLDGKIDRQQSELAQLEAESRMKREAIEILDKTLLALMDETSGIALMEKDGSRYVMVPQDSESGHHINGRPAIKLKE